MPFRTLKKAHHKWKNKKTKMQNRLILKNRLDHFLRDFMKLYTQCVWIARMLGING
jgi:hypothetical protein